MSLKFSCVINNLERVYYKNKVANERQNLTFCFRAFVGRWRNANAPTGVIEITLWQEVEKAELEEELNEPVTDVEPTAEAPAQESGVEPTNPEAAEVVEIKLTTYNLKKAGQAPVSITPESKDLKLEPGDQLIRIYKGTLIEVDVLDSGYKWNGEVYPTLTHISWKATGYQIGGNNFFGLPVKRHRCSIFKNPPRSWTVQCVRSEKIEK